MASGGRQNPPTVIYCEVVGPRCLPQLKAFMKLAFGIRYLLENDVGGIRRSYTAAHPRQFELVLVDLASSVLIGVFTYLSNKTVLAYSMNALKKHR